MKVKALIDFVPVINGRSGLPISRGEEFELPEKVDWLKAGFVAPVVEEKRETATVKPVEKRATTTRRKNTRRKTSAPKASE